MAPTKKNLVVAAAFLSSASAFSFAPAARQALVATRSGRRSRTQLKFSASTIFNRHASPSPEKNEAYLPQVNHRHSARDWVHNIASISQSSILRDVRNPVLTVMGWSTLLSIIHRVCISSSSHVWRSLATNMQVGATAHSFLVSSLGLLLVFRTNSAYQRFAVRQF